MLGIGRLFLWLRTWFRSNRLEDEMDEELRFHLEKLIEDNIQAGMSPQEARYAALRNFGGIEQIKEGCRDMRGTRFVEEFWQDLRYGLRMLRKSPVFTGAAVLSVALGIGANSATFSLMDALILKMLPVRQPEQLVELLTVMNGNTYNSFSFPNSFQEQSPGSELVIHTTGDPMTIAGSVRQAIERVAKGVAIARVTTLARHVDASIVQERLLASLSGFFGALALLLAAIGLYGIMAYSVARRTNEMGIRMALGARPADVLWLVLRETVLLLLVGFAIGLPAALAAGRLISSQLFGVTPDDPVAILAACALMVAVASFAGFLPARKASRVDPMIALRYE